MNVAPSTGWACPFGECDGSGFVVDADARTTRECRCRPQRIARAKARKLSAVIPKRYRGVSFDRPPVTQIEPAVVSEVRRYVRDVDANLRSGRGLWLMGDVGTGKTTLAMLISSEALRRGHAVAIYSLPRLLAEIRKTYDDRNELTYLGLIDSLGSVDLLHVDDVGFERRPTKRAAAERAPDSDDGDDETTLSPWVLEQLYSVVNTRYEDERAMVITTNVSPPDLRRLVGERTVSRLIEMCGDPVPLFGDDKRMPNELAELPEARDWQAPTVRRYGESPVYE